MGRKGSRSKYQVDAPPRGAHVGREGSPGHASVTHRESLRGIGSGRRWLSPTAHLSGAGRRGTVWGQVWPCCQGASQATPELRAREGAGDNLGGLARAGAGGGSAGSAFIRPRLPAPPTGVATGPSLGQRRLRGREGAGCPRPLRLPHPSPCLHSDVPLECRLSPCAAGQVLEQCCFCERRVSSVLPA